MEKTVSLFFDVSYRPCCFYTSVEKFFGIFVCPARLSGSEKSVYEAIGQSRALVSFYHKLDSAGGGLHYGVSGIAEHTLLREVPKWYFPHEIRKMCEFFVNDYFHTV